MNKIPFYIMEEHHEAFFLWHYAMAEGLIGKTQNILLHVDEHSDMMLPILKSSLKSVKENLKEVHDFTYRELTIANFIYPAIYQGIFNQVYWLRQSHDITSSKPKKMYLYSYKGEGRQLILKSEIELVQLFNPDLKIFSTASITVQDSWSDDSSWPSNSSVIIDIDLDYFSCDNASGDFLEFGITQDTYNDYLNNPYNKLRLALGAVGTVKYWDGKYYFCSVPVPGNDPKVLKVSLEEITQRIDAFIAFLKNNKIQPSLIEICRSRLSGYTPNDQWEFIENTLIQKLSTLYEFEPIFIHKISHGVLKASS